MNTLPGLKKNSLSCRMSNRAHSLQSSQTLRCILHIPQYDTIGTVSTPKLPNHGEANIHRNPISSRQNFEQKTLNHRLFQATFNFQSKTIKKPFNTSHWVWSRAVVLSFCFVMNTSGAYLVLTSNFKTPLCLPEAMKKTWNMYSLPLCLLEKIKWFHGSYD